MMGPHLLPLDHPLKAQLDAIFSVSRVLENRQTLDEAGFDIIAAMPGSFVIVARHPAMPGYVFKMYLDSEKRSKDGLSHCEWLVRRCIGAAYLRDIIRKQHIRYFTVPDKWLYILPLYPFSTEPAILVATDMQLVSKSRTKKAWKTCITRKHLDELYSIIKHGYGTTHLVRNLPMTRQGTFAFTDTEHPKRPPKLNRVKSYLSEEMQTYWDTIIKN